MNTKQVIVIRKDLKMRRGKEIAQGSHASMMFLRQLVMCGDPVAPRLTHNEFEWLRGHYAKIVCVANSEQELLDILEAARMADIKGFAAIDIGKTEFHGAPTMTAIAIGPDESEKIDTITGRLQLS